MTPPISDDPSLARCAGLPVTTSATTINRVCGSGLKAVMLAAA